jgi:hypothetical protein
MKAALASLEELGNKVTNRQIYINSLTDEEIFGEHDSNLE